MLIVNNTQHQTLEFDIHIDGAATCGHIPPSGQKALPWFDDKNDVIIGLKIPKTGDQMVVTVAQIGL